MSSISGCTSSTKGRAMYFWDTEAKSDSSRCQTILIWWQSGRIAWATSSWCHCSSCNLNIHRWCEQSREPTQSVRRLDWVLSLTPVVFAFSVSIIYRHSTYNSNNQRHAVQWITLPKPTDIHPANTYIITPEWLPFSHFEWINILKFNQFFPP